MERRIVPAFRKGRSMTSAAVVRPLRLAPACRGEAVGWRPGRLPLVILSGLLCGVAASGIAGAGDWPTYRADAARTGYTAEELPAGLSLAWTFRSRSAPMPAWPTRTRQRFDVAYQPVISHGLLYFGSSADGKVYALDAVQGAIRWEFFTGGPVRFAPVAWRERIFVASDDGYLYCLAAADGRLLWRRRAGPRPDMLLGNDRMISRWPARGGPVVADDVVYFAAGIWPTEGVYILALDAASGQQLWCNDSSGMLELDQPHPTARAKSGVAAQGYLVIDGHRLYVPTGRGVPAVFDRAEGRFLDLQLQTNSHAGGADVVGLGEYFFNSGAVFEAAGETLIARTGIAAALHPEYVILSGKTGRLEGREREKFLVERQATDRKGTPRPMKELAQPVWSLALPDAALLQPIVRPGTEQPEDKVMGSTSFIELPVQGQPAALIVAGNSAVVGGQACVLTVDLSSRAVSWQAPVSGAACGLAVADGRLYVSTDCGCLYCFSAGPTASPAMIEPTAAVLPSEDSQYQAAADEIVRRTGITQGFCLDIACGDGRLALELARRTELQICGLAEDAAHVQAARKLLDQAGLYGTRVTIHHADPAETDYPNRFADLVISQKSVADGADAVTIAKLSRMQCPDGGQACLGRPGAMSPSVRGPLAGAGNWTHQNTSAANTLCSEDTLVRGPLAMLWFRDTDFVMPLRHGRGPAPLVDRGRMFVEGLHGLRATNIYNGRTLWEFPLHNVLRTYHREHSIGAAWTGGNYCLGGEHLYVHTGDRCLRLDAAHGRQVREYQPPPRPDGKPGTWGYLAWAGGTLFGTLADEDYLVRCWSPNWDTGGQFIQSVLLFALDPETGQVKWTYQPERSIRHNAIAIGGGRVYVIDREVPAVDHVRYPLAPLEAEAKRRAQAHGTKPQDELGRLLPQPAGGRLLALDADTGRVVWKQAADVFGTQLAVSEQHGVLLMSYQPVHQASLDSELGDRLAAVRTGDGTRLWEISARYVARPILNDRTIYAEPGAWDLLTGTALPFTLQRSYGCGIPAGSRHLLVFRSATLGYIDLTRGQQTENYGGIRPGCWVNAIPAGGLVLLADAASWCTCSYLNQATLALEPQR